MDSVSRDMCFVMKVFTSCFGVYFNYNIYLRDRCWYLGCSN